MANNKNTTPAPTDPAGVAAAAAVSNDDAPEAAARGASDDGASEGAAEAPAADYKLGDKVRIIAVHGRLVHQHTGQVFDTDNSVKATIDAYALLQLDAGKLQVEAD